LEVCLSSVEHCQSFSTGLKPTRVTVPSARVTSLTCLMLVESLVMPIDVQADNKTPKVSVCAIAVRVFIIIRYSVKRASIIDSTGLQTYRGLPQ